MVVARVGRAGAALTAGDGTMIDAAASRFRLLQTGAAEQAARELRAQAAAAPDDAKVKREAELALKRK